MANPNPSDVAIKIKTMLEEAKPRFTEECCIYRVSPEIRKSNEDAYTPKIVSIGPFHHGDQHLLKMEDTKRIYCRHFIESSETRNLESFVSFVQELEPKVRSCYSDDIRLSEEQHVMVILVDCCFILQFSLKSCIGWTHNDDILLPPNLREPIRYDLSLIENQVPFFVLDKLYHLAFASTLYSGNNDSHPPLTSLTLHIVFCSIIVPDIIITDDMLRQFVYNVGRIAHFTDLSRKFLLMSSRLLQPSSASRSLRKAEFPRIYSATRLNEGGVKFEVNKKSQCILDLELSGHTFRVPSIRVTSHTEAILRNLIAFEQSHCINESYLADYVVALDFLVDTDTDVDLLGLRAVVQFIPTKNLVYARKAC